jgi:hypothetical protein
MALTRDFKQTLVERVRHDPAFARALLDEAATLFSMASRKWLASSCAIL